MNRCQRCFGEMLDFAVFCPHCAQAHEPDFGQLLNQTIGDRYRLYRRLGQGGLSTVFAAMDLQDDQVVVVKVSDPAQLVRRELTYAIDAEAARSYWTEMLERMRREAETLAEIAHPNIVQFFGTGLIGDDLRYVVMEFLRGRTLREELNAKGRLETADANQFTLQACAALGEIHSRGIVHRDINPRNLMIVECGVRSAECETAERQRSTPLQAQAISNEGLQSAIRNPQPAIKLIDFGIAKLPQPPGAPPFTQHSVLSGTVSYASPEQCQSRAVDHRSDIYSLGVVLYEMLTGERPFTGRTPTEIALKQIQAEPTPPRKHNPELPVNLERAILRSLEKAPEARQQSVAELAEDLRQGARQIVIPLFAGHSFEPDAAASEFAADNAEEPDDASSDRLRLVRRRRRRVALIAAALLVAVTAAGIMFGRNWLSSRLDLPQIAGNLIGDDAPSPTPETGTPSDADSLELAAMLPPDVVGPSVIPSQQGLNSSAQSRAMNPSAPAAGNAATTGPANQNGHPASASAPGATTAPPTAPSNAPTPVSPTPPPTDTISRTTPTPVHQSGAQQPAVKPEVAQSQRKSEEDFGRQQGNGTSTDSNGQMSGNDHPNARRDRIAVNRNRDVDVYRRPQEPRREEPPDEDEGEADDRDDQQQVGPKLIQWSGSVNREREITIELPGTPGTLEVPRVYRNRVGVVEPPSSSNRWRCAKLRVFGQGGVSIVVRWWPKVVEYSRMVGRR